MTTEILDFIYEEAKKKYGNEKEANDFVNGFVTKTAGIMDWGKPPGTTTTDKDGNERFNESHAPYFGSSMAKGLGESVGKAIAGAGVTAAVAGLGSMINVYKGHNLYNKFVTSVNEAVKMNVVLKAADKDKVLNYAHTIFKFAPHISTDANILASILANAIHGDGIDPMTIRTLTELESRYTDQHTFEPKKWI